MCAHSILEGHKRSVKLFSSNFFNLIEEIRLVVFFFYRFLEEYRGGERNMDQRETLIGCLLRAPCWGSSPQLGLCPD